MPTLDQRWEATQVTYFHNFSSLLQCSRIVETIDEDFSVKFNKTPPDTLRWKRTRLFKELLILEASRLPKCRNPTARNYSIIRAADAEDHQPTTRRVRYACVTHATRNPRINVGINFARSPILYPRLGCRVMEKVKGRSKMKRSRNGNKVPQHFSPLSSGSSSPPLRHPP